MLDLVILSKSASETSKYLDWLEKKDICIDREKEAYSWDIIDTSKRKYVIVLAYVGSEFFGVSPAIVVETVRVNAISIHMLPIFSIFHSFHDCHQWLLDVSAEEFAEFVNSHSKEFLYIC